MKVLRILAMAASLVALAALGLAVGDFASDPSPLGAIGLLAVLAGMGFALARLYGPQGVALTPLVERGTPRRREPKGGRVTSVAEEAWAPAAAPPVIEEPPRRPARPPREPERAKAPKPAKPPKAPKPPKAARPPRPAKPPKERRAPRFARRGREPGSDLIDLNRDPANVIATLPGVGAASGERIVEERRRNGPYATVSDLARVQGFSPERIRRLDGKAKV